MVDFLAIIEHNLTISQIIDFPTIIDNSTILKSIYKNDSIIRGNNEKVINNEISKKTYWECEDFSQKTLISEFLLLKFWNNNEGTEWIDESHQYQIIGINSYFGYIYFNRRTIMIKFFPQHKYSNLYDNATLNYIRRFNQELAIILNKKVIVYCADSVYPSSILETKAIEGKSIDELIELGISILGKQPDSIEKAVHKGFFIDSLSS